MNGIIISIIAALAEKNRLIGSKGKIPWHLKKDLIRFKEKTTNRAVILGRKTFESLISYYQKSGRPMPKRRHIIITRNKTYKVKVSDCFVVQSIEEAFKLAEKIEKKEVFISGGAEIYKQTINLADKLYLTLVKGDFKGDAFFPDYRDFKKKIFEPEVFEEKGIKFRFVELKR